MLSGLRQRAPERDCCEKDSSDRRPQADEQEYSYTPCGHTERSVPDGGRMREGCVAIDNEHEARNNAQNQEPSTRSTEGKIGE